MAIENPHGEYKSAFYLGTAGVVSTAVAMEGYAQKLAHDSAPETSATRTVTLKSEHNQLLTDVMFHVGSAGMLIFFSLAAGVLTEAATKSIRRRLNLR